MTKTGHRLPFGRRHTNEYSCPPFEIYFLSEDGKQKTEWGGMKKKNESGDQLLVLWR